MYGSWTEYATLWTNSLPSTLRSSFVMTHLKTFHMSGKNPKEFVHKKEIRKIRTRGASVKYKCCPNETE